MGGRLADGGWESSGQVFQKNRRAASQQVVPS
jgi:hypothetical protein